MNRKAISDHQSKAMRLEVLRAYFDFREGRPTADSVAKKLGIPIHTVRTWIADERNASLLDQVAPLWPNIGGAREFASDLVPEALQAIAETMRGEHGARARDRYEAARFLLSLAGVRPTEGPVEDPTSGDGKKRPAVLLNLFLGGGEGEKSIRVIEGEARQLPEPSDP